jgi:hypothetical protein
LAEVAGYTGVTADGAGYTGSVPVASGPVGGAAGGVISYPNLTVSDGGYDGILASPAVERSVAFADQAIRSVGPLATVKGLVDAVKAAASDAEISGLKLPLGEVPAELALSGASGAASTASVASGLIGAATVGVAVGRIIDNLLTYGLGESLGAWAYDQTHPDSQ